MIHEALAKLTKQQHTKLDKIQHKPSVFRVFLTTVGFLPAFAFYYIWCLTAVKASFNPVIDIWRAYLPVHIGLAGLLMAILIFAARFSERAQHSNKYGLFGCAFLGCGLISVAVPNGYNLGTLILLGLAVVYYWFTPWSSIRVKWQPIHKQTKIVSSMAFQLMERITDLPYPSIREAWIPLMDELLSIAKDPPVSEKNIPEFSQFCTDLSLHFAPLLGALTFRAKSLGNDDPALMTFIKTYPPFPESDRIRYNRVSFYKNIASQDSTTDERIQILWLKSALILADNKLKTSADTLFDVELMLLPMLLKDPFNHSYEISLLLQRVMQRLAENDAKLNAVQQNSWLRVLEILGQQQASQPELVNTFTQLHRQFPQHIASFAEDSVGYSAQRTDRLNQVIADLVNGQSNDTDSTLDALFEGLMHEVLKCSGRVLQEFMRSSSSKALGALLLQVSDDTREAFYEKHLHTFDSDAREFFAPIFSKPITFTLEEKQAIAEYLMRMLSACQRLVTLLERQVEEMDATNYLNEENRYETDLEDRLNRAVLQRVDKVDETLKPILLEFKQDIESQQIDFGEFMPHLGRKFGALIYSIEQCFPDETYRWFLEQAGNSEITLIDADINHHTNFLMLVMHYNMAFHWQMRKQDHLGSFNTLLNLLNLLIVRYPLNRIACEATLVSCMQLISLKSLNAEALERFFDTLGSLPEILYPQLTFEQQDNLMDVIKRGAAAFDLTKINPLNDNQLTILNAYLN